MKKLYHVCLSSKREVLFRNQEDKRYFINSLALTLFKTHTDLFVDTEMSNHVHLSVMSEKINTFIGTLRMRYAKYFNNKYSRSGGLGEIRSFCTEIKDLSHTLTAWSYILRNGLHHGVSATAYGYKYSTVSHIFKKEFNREQDRSRLITSRAEISSWLPRRAEFPDEYVMDHDGQFMRESFTQIQQVELNYGSPRSFDYFMSRLSGEEWEREQQKEARFGDPITLRTIEGGVVSTPVERMMKNEYKRFDSGRMGDMDLCRLIDEDYLPMYRCDSVYLLASGQKAWIAQEIQKSGCRVSDNQLRRCLVM